MMTDHLLLVTIGPVQEFIAQARRTRDLWHGSHMISELSRAVARSLASAHAYLLIPALEAGDVALDECWAPIRPGTHAPPEAIANKIWAVVPTGLDPEALAKAAREAGKNCLRAHAATVWDALGSLLPQGVEAVWHEQVEDALEFTAGWMALGERPFSEVREQLDDAVSARKRLREFVPWQQQRGAVPKSSLDGARESVLPAAHKKPARKRLREGGVSLGLQEELDAIGLIKRAGASPEQFIPLVNVALAPWLAWAAREYGEELEACRRACADLKVQPIKSSMLADDFRYEASVLLPDRWKSLAKEQGYGEPELAERWEVMKRAVNTLRKATHAAADEPYVACVVADGDRMGDTINRIQTPGDLRSFSAKLSSFAMGAREVIKAHQGSLVYAGGDDVLAFVPVSSALDCAEKLRTSFQAIVGGACEALGLVDDAHPLPSLSVGVGVGHYMESMGELLRLGREAEALAKGSELREKSLQRNALAIIVDKRSGGRRTWRMQWSGDPGAQIRHDIALLTELSVTKVHEIKATLERLPVAPAAEDEFAEVLERELSRSLARTDGKGLTLDQAGLSLKRTRDYRSRRAAAYEWIDRILIARELDRADTRPRLQGTPT